MIKVCELTVPYQHEQLYKLSFKERLGPISWLVLAGYQREGWEPEHSSFSGTEVQRELAQLSQSQGQHCSGAAWAEDSRSE